VTFLSHTSVAESEDSGSRLLLDTEAKGYISRDAPMERDRADGGIGGLGHIGAIAKTEGGWSMDKEQVLDSEVRLGGIDTEAGRMHLRICSKRTRHSCSDSGRG
jgi:hypothetical protein